MRHSNRSGCRFRACSAHHPTARPHTDRPQRSCGSRYTARTSIALRLPGEAAEHLLGRPASRAGRGRPGKRSQRNPCVCPQPNAPRCWCWQDHRRQAGGRRRTYKIGTPRSVLCPKAQVVLPCSSPDIPSTIPARIRLVGGSALQPLLLRAACPHARATGRDPASVVRSRSS